MSLGCPECGRPYSEFDPRCVGCGSPLPTMTPTAALPASRLAAGGRVDRFEILGELGRGGMGVVYRARDLQLGREVALKLLKGEGDPERVLAEARAVAALDHPAIGTLYEVGKGETGAFLVLALYAGRNLAQELRERGPLPPGEALAVARQLAGALAAAHAAGILHRDVKPSNVFLLEDGRVKLLDFGIALAGHSGDGDGWPRLGTPAYMAPERLLGEESGPAGDVWSFGVVAWETLTGARPPAARGSAGGPASLDGIAVPPGVEPLLLACLAPDPDRRPSATELARRLTEAEEELARRAAPASRRRWAVAALALATAAAVSFVVLRPRAAPLAVSVLEPTVSGALAAGDSERLVANLEAASWRALLGLADVEALDRALARGVANEAPAVARATAADETLGWEATCPGVDLCSARLLRRDAAGRVLGSETVELSASADTLSARAAAAAVRRVYPELRPRDGPPAAEPSPDVYRRYLELRAAIDLRRLPPEAALEALADLARDSPAFPELAALEGGICRYLLARDRDAGWLARGLAAVDAGLAAAPGHPVLLATRVDLLLAADRLAEARDALAALEASGAGLSDVLVRRARLAEGEGRPEEALEVLRRLVTDRPAAPFLLTLANLEQRLGRPREARAHLEQALERAPDNAQARAQLAGLDLAEGRLGPAEEAWRRLAEETPTLDALANYGLVLLLRRRFGEAEAVLRRAHALAPDHAETRLNLADALALAGRRAEAEALYRGLVDGEAGGAVDDWPLWAVRAQAHAHLGEAERARAATREMLRRAPERGEAAVVAALVHTRLGDRAAALAEARRAVAAGSGRVWFELPFFDPLAAELAAAGIRAAAASR